MRDGTGTLAQRCERILVAAARLHRVGTRQQVRAAARRFVRCHRRDAGYLGWVLRSVGASSALAVALLGFSSAPAGAELASFGPQTGAANPLNGLSTGFNAYSRPSFGDLDGDGDLDLVAGESDGTLNYFENTGSATSPAFLQRTGAANPLNGQDVGTHSAPSLGDVDGDGDLDLVAGEYNGTFLFFENTGDATSPAFLPRTGVANPLNGQDVGAFSTPALGDLDGDGDLDLVSGQNSGTFNYFENTGDASSPAFTGGTNPLAGRDVGTFSAPSLGDLDGDGDLDLVSGEGYATFFTFENTGNVTSPAFLPRTGAANPLDGQDLGFRSFPSLGDLDGDGDLDLVAGENDGTFNTFENLDGFLLRTGSADPLDGNGRGLFSSLGDLDGDGDLDLVLGADFGFEGSSFLYFENTGSAVSPALIERFDAANPFDGLFVSGGGAAPRPSLGDLDGDGDLDLVAGNENGTFVYLENTGSAASPAFIARTGAANPLNGQDVGDNSTPSLGDLDGDGDLDLVAGESDGVFNYFENTSSTASPAFILRIGAANPLDGRDVGVLSTPSLGDLDGDGDLDLVAGESDGVFNYFENTGSAASPAFIPRTGAANPLDGQDVEHVSSPSLGDLDGDGDLDLIVGSLVGSSPPFSRHFTYFESFVAQGGVSIRELSGSSNPVNGQDVGSRAGPALADLDGDGDGDLVAGESFGAFLFFENTGTAIAPAFLARTGAANPLNGRDVGDEAKPVLGDLDGDGDFDLVAGRLAGDFSYFANTGDATTPLFAAPLANPFGLAGVGSNSAPVLGDLDADGDLDLVSGELDGVFTYYENTGDATAPAFVLRTGAANPLDGRDVGSSSTSSLADFDRDGDLDLVAGESDGSFNYFKNQGSATSATFAPLTGAANPLNGRDVGDDSAPAAGSLNGDGFPDLVTGSQAGTFAVHYFPEPARGALFAAGIALLSLLDRARRRSPR